MYKKTLKILIIVLIMCSALKNHAAENHTYIITNQDVIDMAKAGLTEQIIIETIKRSNPAFDLLPKEMVKLKEFGVSDNIIQYMIAIQKDKKNTPEELVIKELRIIAGGKEDEKIAALDRVVMRQNEQDIRKIIRNNLYSDKPELRAAAAIVSARLNDKNSINTIRQMLIDNDKNVREDAAAALAVLKDYDNVNNVIKELENKVTPADGYIRFLGFIKEQKAVNILKYILVNNPDNNLRSLAAWALGNIADKTAIKDLQQALYNDIAVGVRKNAVIALGKMNDPILVPVIEDACRKIVDVRKEALIALANYKQAVKFLVEAIALAGDVISIDEGEVARSSLKQLTGVDYGLNAEAWKNWYKKNQQFFPEANEKKKYIEPLENVEVVQKVKEADLANWLALPDPMEIPLANNVKSKKEQAVPIDIPLIPVVPVLGGAEKNNKDLFEDTMKKDRQPSMAIPVNAVENNFVEEIPIITTEKISENENGINNSNIEKNEKNKNTAVAKGKKINKNNNKNTIPGWVGEYEPVRPHSYFIPPPPEDKVEESNVEELFDVSSVPLFTEGGIGEIGAQESISDFSDFGIVEEKVFEKIETEKIDGVKVDNIKIEENNYFPDFEIEKNVIEKVETTKNDNAKIEEYNYFDDFFPNAYNEVKKDLENSSVAKKIEEKSEDIEDFFNAISNNINDNIEEKKETYLENIFGDKTTGAIDIEEKIYLPEEKKELEINIQEKNAEDKPQYISLDINEKLNVVSVEDIPEILENDIINNEQSSQKNDETSLENYQNLINAVPENNEFDVIPYFPAFTENKEPELLPYDPENGNYIQGEYEIISNENAIIPKAVAVESKEENIFVIVPEENIIEDSGVIIEYVPQENSSLDDDAFLNTNKPLPPVKDAGIILPEKGKEFPKTLGESLFK